MRKNYLILLIILLVLISAYLLNSKKNIVTNPISVIPTKPTITPTPTSNKTYPIAEFNQRITKKPFGIYITPKTSPIKPERFQGYHTGVDVEYEDVTTTDVPVFAVCNGNIVLSKWVSGYGGTAILKCQINNVDYFILYGHLKASSITKNSQVKKGDQIAILGTGHTKETDFERKHLHFSVHPNSLYLKGYVQTQNELQNWIDPVYFLNQIL